MIKRKVNAISDFGDWKGFCLAAVIEALRRPAELGLQTFWRPNQLQKACQAR